MAAQQLSYLVAIPIPSLTRGGKRISKRRREDAAARLLEAFGDWFGGATAMPCLGTWEMLDGAGLAVDRKQVVVVSMTTRRKFLRALVYVPPAILTFVANQANAQAGSCQPAQCRPASCAPATCAPGPCPPASCRPAN